MYLMPFLTLQRAQSKFKMLAHATYPVPDQNSWSKVWKKKDAFEKQRGMKDKSACEIGKQSSWCQHSMSQACPHKRTGKRASCHGEMIVVRECIFFATGYPDEGQS